MNNFNVIYKILKFLESSLDYEEVDYSRISCEALGISRVRWEQLLIMLSESGYINGLVYSKDMTTGRPFIAEPIKPLITLKGLEYLADNSMMAKAASIAKGALSLGGMIK